MNDITDVLVQAKREMRLKNIESRLHHVLVDVENDFKDFVCNYEVGGNPEEVYRYDIIRGMLDNTFHLLSIIATQSEMLAEIILDCIFECKFNTHDAKFYVGHEDRPVIYALQSYPNLKVKYLPKLESIVTAKSTLTNSTAKFEYLVNLFAIEVLSSLVFEDNVDDSVLNIITKIVDIDLKNHHHCFSLKHILTSNISNSLRNLLSRLKDKENFKKILAILKNLEDLNLLKVDLISELKLDIYEKHLNDNYMEDDIANKLGYRTNNRTNTRITSLMEDDIADKLDRIQENFFKLEEATKKIINMSTPIRISNDMINAAKIHADLESRSLTKQIEHWAKIGKIAEENPDLNYGFIKDILLSKLEIDNNEVEEYVGLSCKS